MRLTNHEQVAQGFVGAAWTALQSIGGQDAPPTTHGYFPAAFNPEWLREAALPLDTSQIIHLGDREKFERMTPEEAEDAYAAHQRTKVYGQFDTGWVGIAGRYLMMLARREVLFSAFESLPTDETLGPHTDDWGPAIALQFEGEKAWRLGDAAWQEDAGPTRIMRPGDLMIIPRGYPHDVFTLSDRSLHLTVGIRLDKPITLPETAKYE